MESYNMCMYNYLMKMSQAKWIPSCLYSVYTTTEHTIQSSWPSTVKRQTFCHLMVTLCNLYKHRILQFWHINKSPAFQARGRKAVTLKFNLGILYIILFLNLAYMELFKDSHQLLIWQFLKDSTIIILSSQATDYISSFLLLLHLSMRTHGS